MAIAFASGAGNGRQGGRPSPLLGGVLATGVLVGAALLASFGASGCGDAPPDWSVALSSSGSGSGGSGNGSGGPSASSGSITSSGSSGIPSGSSGSNGGSGGSSSGPRGPTVETPTFSPAAGPFYGATPVTITSTTPGATIRYTTDGSTPTETHGTLYAGPVTMQQAVNIDMTQTFVTNASGVTMLKAVAYESGLADSTVFTGNYIVINPLRYAQKTSLVQGLAHVAYNVSSQNWTSVFGLWTSYLGYDTVTTSSGFALVKINDQQFIELYEKPIVSPQYQLANWGFYVSDCEAHRQQVSKAGVSVPASCTTNALGNLSFETTDPDGHQNELVQYMPGSVTSNSLGQHMPGTQLFGYLEDYGDATGNVTAADAYYQQVGFAGNGIKVYLPNNNCYLEMLTYTTLTQQEAGKHEKAQLVTFRGTDLITALNALQARDPSLAQTRATEGGGGFPTHNCGDVYNADLSRVRMIDINY
jgi:hypothetical protein